MGMITVDVVVHHITFFESYNQSDSLGEMVTAMLNRNIQDIPSDSLASYTVMEHILLGDPSVNLKRVALK